MGIARCLIIFAVLLMAGDATAGIARGGVTRIWHLDTRGDSLSLKLNLFPEIEADFPAKWLRVHKSVSGSESPKGQYWSAVVSLVEVSPGGGIDSSRLRFYALYRLARNEHVFLNPVSREEDPWEWLPDEDGLPVGMADVPTVTLDLPDDLRDLGTSWYCDPTGNWILLSQSELSLVYHLPTKRIVRADTLHSRALQTSHEKAWYAAIQGRHLGSDAYLGRIAVLTWSGYPLWASPWVHAEHDYLHLFPDGKSLHYTLDYERTYAVSTPDDRRRELPALPIGRRYYAADGSRMLVTHRSPPGDRVTIYDTADPLAPIEVASMSWPEYCVTCGSASASGSSFAITLQARDRSRNPRYELVVLDETCTELHREALSSPNPAIQFLGEFLVLGSDKDKEEHVTSNPGYIEVFWCP